MLPHFDLQEPNFDDYLFCDACGHSVIEYCSIHGALLVIPDDKISTKRNYPAIVPRAALSAPQRFVHIAPSAIPGAGLGVFATRTLPRGVRFGPYKGSSTNEVKSDYCWEIQDDNNRRSHVIDARDPTRSNWLRYVNCARTFSEQNLLAYQYKGQIYYRTIKIIPPFTELLVFYGSEYAVNLQIDLRCYKSSGGCSKDGDAEKPEENDRKFSNSSFKKTVFEKHCNNPGALSRDSDSDSSIQLSSDEDSFIGFPKTPKTITPSQVYVCNECLEQFYCKDELILHLNLHKFICNLCGYENFNIKNFTNHLFTLHNPDALNDFKVTSKKCLMCNEVFKERDFKRHVLNHIYGTDKSKKIICNICNVRLTNNRGLREHLIRLHRPMIVLQCQICFKIFDSVNKLNDHLRFGLHRPFETCPYCLKHISKRQFMIHLGLHEKENTKHNNRN